MQLSKITKIVRHNVAVASGSSVITPSAGVDTLGYLGCLFLVTMGAIDDASETTIKVQQSDDDGVADAYSDLAGSNQAVAGTDDNDYFYVDVFKPTKRYLLLIITRATNVSTVNSITAILYDPVKAPTTHDAVVNGEAHVSPAEGTA